MHYWRLELMKLTLLVGTAAIAGYIFGEILLFLLAALVGSVVLHLYQLRRIDNWLLKSDNGDRLPPASLGRGWTALIESISQVTQNNPESVSNPETSIPKPPLVKKNLFAQAEIGTLILDSNGVVNWCNDASEILLGLTITNGSDKHISSLVRDERLLQYLESKRYNLPLRAHSPRDDKRVLEYQVLMFTEQERIVLVRDITQLDRLESMRKDFVGNLSHELRTPITVIQGYSEAMLDNIGDVDKKWKKPLKQMHQSSIRMKNLIKDLLILSSLETEAPTGQRDDVDLLSLLMEITGDTRQVFKKKKHEYTVECDPQVRINGDRGELYSAVSNLLSNAAKYTDKRGSIKIEASTSAENFIIEIIDNGLGIEKQHIPRLTERFYRVSESRNTDTGGTGLGLAIVKHILARHDGELEVHSLIGIGSRFVCKLPLSRISKAEPSIAKDFTETSDEAAISGDSAAV